MSISELSCGMVYSTRLRSPFEKLSIFAAEGNLTIPDISSAAELSGLIENVSPNSLCINTICEEYSGLRRRATVYFAPSFLPITQAITLSSSCGETAIRTSAFSMPASRNISMQAPLPFMTLYGRPCGREAITSLLFSITVTSLLSCARFSAMAEPTLP